MLLDGHIHINQYGQKDRPKFTQKLKTLGIDGGIILSLPPKSFPDTFPDLNSCFTTQERLDNLFYWADALENLCPFYWVNPIEPGAIEQVQMATKQGVLGFKVICNSFYPWNKQAMEVYGVIAELGRPIIFHSGVLGGDESASIYNRPAEFKILSEVKGLRFSLAHISWPWHDEVIALFGEALNTRKLRPDAGEMFLDLTPGAMGSERREALTGLFKTVHGAQDNLFFGTDQIVTYDGDCLVLNDLVKSDTEVYRSLGLKQSAIDKIFSGNLKRFIGLP